MKTLYLHIGTPKTGTTALQVFLRNNLERLASQNYYIPLDGLANNEHLALMTSNENCNKIRGYLDKLTSKGEGAYILSCELFYTMPCCFDFFHEFYNYEQRDKNKAYKEEYKEQYKERKANKVGFLARILPEYFDEIKIVLYLRRQDLFLNSIYIQDVQFFYSGEIDEYSEIFSFEIDYQKNVALWADNFGKEHIIIVPYEREAMPRGIEGSFCDLIGIDIARLTKQTTEHNPTITEEIFQFKKDFNKAFLNADFDLDVGAHFQFYGYIDAILKHNPGTGPKFVALPYEAALAITQKYKAGNAALAKEYLGRDNLFLQNEPEPYELPHVELNNARRLEFLSTFIILTQLGVLYKNKDITRIFKEAESWNYTQDKAIETLKQRLLNVEKELKIKANTDIVLAQRHPDVVPDSTILEYKLIDTILHRPLPNLLYKLYTFLARMPLLHRWL